MAPNVLPRLLLVVFILMALQPQPTGASQEADGPFTGTLVVLGRVHVPPYSVELSPLKDDVLVNGGSLRGLLTAARQVRLNGDVPEVYVRRHQAIVDIVEQARTLRSGDRSELVDFARTRPGVSDVRLRDTELEVVWNDGDSELVLLQQPTATKADSSTVDTFVDALPRHLRTLRGGGLVAVGVTYVLSASGAEAQTILDSMHALIGSNATAEDAISELERVSSNRAFATDYVSALRQE